MSDTPSDSAADSPIEITIGGTPDAAVIWLHGLGADGNDFVPIVSEMSLPKQLGVRFVFPHAPFRPVTCNGGYVMRAWYDVYSLENIEQEDEAGLNESRNTIEALIDKETRRGIDPARIVLMGFSQGGAIVLHSGLRHQQKLGGIGALSTYLPLHKKIRGEANPVNFRTPIFMGHGTHDPVVGFRLGVRSRDILQAMNYPLQWHEYPMQHSVCPAEIHDISQWLVSCLHQQ